MELLDKDKRERSDRIPMPFFGMGGRIILTLYWWIYRVLFFKGGLNYKNTIEQLDTPWKVQAWLWANIKYTADKNPADSWQPAERTFDRKRGDCEDWAIFSNECLKDKYEGYFICMYDRSSGHCDYLIRTVPDTYTSIGTYGLMYHKGSFRAIVPNWSGFEDWTDIVVYDEDLKVITRMER